MVALILRTIIRTRAGMVDVIPTGYTNRILWAGVRMLWAGVFLSCVLGWCDSDYDTFSVSRRSVTGWMVFLGSSRVS